MSSAPTLFGVPLKYLSLVTLTVQNSSLILVMHYSRVMPGYTADSRYYASTAVLLNEIIKFVFCTIVCVYQQGFKSAFEDVFSGDCWKLSIPAFLYTLQNTLQYVAVSNLDAATFQVTYQLKILTTAFFAVTILHKDLSKLQWLCLVLLTFGIGLVQMPPEAFNGLVAFVIESATTAVGKGSPVAEGPGSTKPAGGSASKLGAKAAKVVREVAAAVVEKEEMNGLIGFVAVSIACILSGLAGIYFEKVLKGSKKVSLWTRNVQLSMFSLIPALFLGVLAKDGSKIAENGFFHGYNNVVWAAIWLQAIGGIVVALCVKFADNIAKNFATSISILISFVASVYFFDFAVHVNFLIGATVVVGVTYLYSLSPASARRPSSSDEEYKPLPDQRSRSD
ncbi:UDP-galactose transporter Gms1 [Sugiyamaella lignohabitans]|uniref:UDP-galactose transporter Gms1 n=1 Tax=Sugiyamaella lignohabitans TaxID=796027 RepID=A0A167DAY4_9ASCO|nr:UDP-galactose transporter Gms1 [Sugiyamaella lignohabitans]ANB12694.1 UDP-galactose transporter Gms1 [Sugiyamaella lignohabitans]